MYFAQASVSLLGFYVLVVLWEAPCSASLISSVWYHEYDDYSSVSSDPLFKLMSSYHVNDEVDYSSDNEGKGSGSGDGNYYRHEGSGGFYHGRQKQSINREKLTKKIALYKCELADLKTKLNFLRGIMASTEYQEIEGANLAEKELHGKEDKWEEGSPDFDRKDGEDDVEVKDKGKDDDKDDDKGNDENKDEDKSISEENRLKTEIRSFTNGLLRLEAKLPDLRETIKAQGRWKFDDTDQEVYYSGSGPDEGSGSFLRVRDSYSDERKLKQKFTLFMTEIDYLKQKFAEIRSILESSEFWKVHGSKYAETMPQQNGCALAEKGTRNLTSIHVVRSCEGSSLAMTCPPEIPIIHINRAIYGRTAGSSVCPHQSIHTFSCQTSNADHIVRQKCEGRNSSCVVEASSSVFGDPCPGTHKYLEVEFTCEPKPVFNRVCQGKVLQLSCPIGQRLKIVNGFYGRLAGEEICPHRRIITQKCVATNSMYVLSRLCDGQSSCRVPANTIAFGDPCYGTHKYLEVYHKCM